MMEFLLGSGWLGGMVARWLSARCGGTRGTVSLKEDSLWSHQVDACQHLFTCREGQVWLTREGDGKDHILAAGETLRLDQPGLVVVQALRPASFELSLDTSTEPVATCTTRGHPIAPVA